DLARIVALFRDREARARASGFLPAAEHLEWAFGRDAGRPLVLGTDPGMPEPFALRGQVDRVDLRPGTPPTAIVTDYKTSKGAVEERDRAVRHEADVQLPLYALAVERLLGARVAGLE